MSPENPIWGTPKDDEKPGYQVPYQGLDPVAAPRKGRRKRWIPLALVIAAVGGGWAAANSQDDNGSGYDPISPQESGMCRLLTPAEVDEVLGGTAAYDDRIYDGDTCEYLSLQTDLGYNVTLRLHRDELDADMGDYYRQSILDDITSTEAVEVKDVGELAALDRPDHQLVFISDGVQYELILDNNDYADKRPSSKDDEQASAELARTVLSNAAGGEEE